MILNVFNCSFMNIFQNKILLFFYNLSMSSRFEMGTMMFIFLNMVALAIHHYKEPQSVHDVLFMMDVIFTFIFGLEALVKLIGLQLHYFRVAWNIFDLSIVVLSTLGKCIFFISLLLSLLFNTKCHTLFFQCYFWKVN